MDDKPFMTVEQVKRLLPEGSNNGILYSYEPEDVVDMAREIIRLNQIVEDMKAEHNAEVQQMNDGFDAYEQGELIDNQPSYDVDYDVWQIGWVWAQHNHPKPTPNMAMPGV